MFLVRVVESLITDVLITPENLPEPQKVFDGITGQIKEVARSLSYLNIDDETVNECVDALISLLSSIFMLSSCYKIPVYYSPDSPFRQ